MALKRYIKLLVIFLENRCSDKKIQKRFRKNLKYYYVVIIFASQKRKQHNNRFLEKFTLTRSRKSLLNILKICVDIKLTKAIVGSCPKFVTQERYSYKPIFSESTKILSTE